MNGNPDDLEEDDIPEMDLSGGVRGKYYDRYMRGANVVLLEPDVARVFRSSATVNQVLRELAERQRSSDGGNDSSTVAASSETTIPRPYRIVTTSMFWESLTLLDDKPEVASELMALLQQVKSDPYREATVSESGIRVAGVPEKVIDGHVAPPLRIAYALSEQDRSIEFVAVHVESPAAKMPVKIAAKIERFLRRAV